eukprot:GHVR01115266.1.p1 GENE.GHVR01115266.1~~GHVR01115266.1.p1  ORF type:complete len:138 (+),score=0.65 GHVR01115266.1:378-791(+)
MNIVTTTDKREVVIQLIQFLTKRYYEIINSNIPDVQILLESLLTILHTAILAHKNYIPSSNNLLNDLCQLASFHIKKFGVESEGLSIISALSISFNKAFAPRMEEYWQYVVHGLDMIDQKSTFKAALSCTGDFARVF